MAGLQGSVLLERVQLWHITATAVAMGRVSLGSRQPWKL